jgi:hypothetical protein
MNNEDLKVIAEKVLTKVPNKEPEKFGSIIMILMVISIILTLVRVIQECNKKKVSVFNRRQKYEYYGQQVKDISIRKSWFTKMIVKKSIRKELDKEDYRLYGNDLTNAILDTGENLTEDEIITLVEAANG